MVVWFMYYNTRTSEPFYFWGNCVLVALYVLLYFYLGKAYDAFIISHNRISETAISQALAITLADVAFYLVTVLLYSVKTENGSSTGNPGKSTSPAGLPSRTRSLRITVITVWMALR